MENAGFIRYFPAYVQPVQPGRGLLVYLWALDPQLAHHHRQWHYLAAGSCRAKLENKACLSSMLNPQNIPS